MVFDPGEQGPQGEPGGGGSPLDAWPVGAVFIGVVTTSPATLLGGGTWARAAEGRMLISQSSDPDFDTVRETGGAKTVTLTEAEIPAHAHSKTSSNAAGNSGTSWTRGTGTQSTQTSNATGGGGAHENMPPYFTVYMWERTA